VKALFLPLFLMAALLSAGCEGEVSTSRATPPPATPTALPPAGPAASIDPRSGPAGTTVTVTGSGWPARAPVAINGAGQSEGRPYATIVTTESGSFRVSFVLERRPDGAPLEVGRYDLIASSGTVEVRIPFQVLTPRPVGQPREGG
jgi:hypothetical protein